MSHERLSSWLDAGGHMPWPLSAEHRTHFIQILESSEEGGSNVGECLQVAARVRPGDDESWYEEWRNVADISAARGEVARKHNNLCTARGNWLRASNYYRASGLFLKLEDKRRHSILDSQQTCSLLFLQHLLPAGESVRIPIAETDIVEGYFLPASSNAPRSPAVICVGGPGHCKEEHLYKMPRHALERGLSLLLVDLPGQGAFPRQSRIFGRHAVENSISRCLDYLIERPDVDERQIAIYGEGLGASFASRAAALDHRFSAAVCDAGLWDLREKAYAISWSVDFGDQHGLNAELRRSYRLGIGKRIKCPVLVAMSGRDDPSSVVDAVSLLDYYQRKGLDISLKTFGTLDRAPPNAQVYSPTIDNEFIYDWISAQLAKKSKGDFL